MDTKNSQINEEEHWRKHFKNYDLFLLNHEKYCAMLRFHLEAMREADSVLDSGAGTGNLTKALLQAGHQVTAVDKNKYALELLRTKCVGFSGLHTIQIDLEKRLPFDEGTFDGVVSSFVLPYVSDFEHYFNEHFRVLGEGGMFSASIAMPIPGIMDKYILPALEADLKIKGLYFPNQDAWQSHLKTTYENEKTILKYGRSQEEIFDLLTAAGFQRIEESVEKPYDEYILLVKAQKQFYN
jgi:ubiquinone/menaquinone biosynthesis C-methylase UbiE